MKLTSVLAAFCFLLTGCVGGLNVNKYPINIGFRPVIGHDTRAEESVPFPEDKCFRLWAQKSLLGTMHIEDETISYNNGWFASKSWPETELHFEACWPTDLPTEYTRSKGIQLKDFDCSGGDVDVMLAVAESDYEIDSLVILRFEHILSRVEFRMLHSLSEEMSVRLKKIEMNGFALKGDYNTKHSSNWSTSDASCTYTVYDAGDTDGITILNGKAQYVGLDFYAIPQTCKASVDVTYEVRYGDATWIPQTESISSLDTQWDQSKHYTYTLNLRMDKLTHTTGISSWSNRE